MQGFCGVTTKYLVFFTNLLVFLAGCLSLGYGIYALASDDDDFDNDSLDWLHLDSFIGSLDDDGSWSSSKLPEVVLVVASAVVIILTFLGCCGALRESRVAIFFYFLILLVLSLAAVAGATIAFGRSVSELRQPLLRSMSHYRNDHDFAKMTRREAAITRKWDRVQTQFGCCGVDGYSDWSAKSPRQFPDGSGRIVPNSCCGPDYSDIEDGDNRKKDQSSLLLEDRIRSLLHFNSTSKLINECAKNPGREAYNDRTNGCLTALVFTSEDGSNKDQAVGYATLAIILAMVLDLVVIFGFGLCLVPKGAYQQVE